jgi:BolA protein
MSQGEISSDSVSVESLLRQRLADLAPSRLELIDDSARHAGHAGAKNGGGHYRLLVVSAAFVGKSTVARHRMIYSALGELMRGKIHALSIESLAPNEV